MWAKHFGWFKVFPIGVGLMTGLLGGIREAVILFAENPDPLWQRKLFWFCVWIACFLSLITAWVLKQRELIAEKSKNTRPGFRVEILKLSITHKVSLAEFRTTGTTILTQAYFVNERPKESTVRGFSLEIAKDGNTHVAKRAGDGIIYHPLAVGGEGEQVLNLNTLVNSRYFKDGEGQTGFLVFKLDEVLPQAIVNGVATLIITDAYNGKHRSEGFPVDFVSEAAF